VVTIAITAALVMLPMLSLRLDQMRREAARKSIFEEIDEALSKAQKASDSDKQVVAIKELIETYDKRLGALNTFAKDVSGPFETLRKAVETRKKKKDATSAETTLGASLKLLDTPAGSLNYAPPPAPDPATKPKPEEVGVTVDDRDEEISKALKAFGNVWKKDKIDDLLSKAQGALLNVGPKRRED
jgi:hypothetical protein